MGLTAVFVAVFGFIALQGSAKKPPKPVTVDQDQTQMHVSLHSDAVQADVAALNANPSARQRTAVATRSD